MTLLLAVIALRTSIYAVLPRERRLELRLRINVFDLLLAVVAAASILYCEYYPFIYNHPVYGVRLSLPRSTWSKGLKRTDVSDLILVSWAVLTAAHMRLRRLSRWNIESFRKLLDKLLWAGGFEEIFNILERHKKPLFRLRVSNYWLARIKRWCEPSSLSSFDAAFLRELEDDDLPQLTDIPAPRSRRARNKKALSKYVADLLQFRLFWLRRLLPDYREIEDIAGTIIQNIFLSEFVVRQLVTLRPYLGISVLETWEKTDRDRSEFIQIYLWKLVEDPSSIFYTELRNNRNLTSGGRYYLPPSNKLLSYFLADARVAKDHSAYKPIGDFALMMLDELGQTPERDPYNRALGYFREHEASKSPLLAVIRFFDIMVEEALHQNVEWHMWLYYLSMVF